MRPPPASLPALVLPVLFAAACAGPAVPDAAAVAHAHRFTATVTITADGLLPAAAVDVPAFATVLWRNGTAAPVEVAVHAGVCNACDTVLGFAPAAAGVRSTPIAPGAVATLCFHDPGEFRFTVVGAGVEREGTVRVGGGG